MGRISLQELSEELKAKIDSANDYTDLEKQKNQKNTEDILANKEEVDTHLADIVSQAEPNKIPRALETGKLDVSWIPSDGAWVKIAQVKLEANTASVEFDDIPDKFNTLRLIISANASALNIHGLQMTFNGDNINNNKNYDTQRLSSNNTNSGSSRLSGYDYFQSSSLGGYMLGKTLSFTNIYNSQDRYRAMTTTAVCFDDEGNVMSNLNSGVWKKTEKINKISLNLNSGVLFRMNSSFTLWGCE